MRLDFPVAPEFWNLSEAVRPSGLDASLEFPGSRPVPYHSSNLFLVVPGSTSRPHF